MSFIVHPYPTTYYPLSHSLSLSRTHSLPYYPTLSYTPYHTTTLLDSVLCRSRIQSQYRNTRLYQNDLRRSRLQTQLANVRFQAEATLRRSRVEAESALTNMYTNNLLRRSRLGYELEKAAAETALRNSRVASQIIGNQVESDLAFRESVRRLRDFEADSIIKRI